jgi:hypothetical protein
MWPSRLPYHIAVSVQIAVVMMGMSGATATLVPISTQTPVTTFPPTTTETATGTTATSVPTPTQPSSNTMSSPSMATQDIGIDLVSAKFADESVAQVLLFLSITQFAIVTMKFSFSSVLKFSKN